jgi:hypothetical protein
MSLRALLDDSARFDAEYGGGLSTHLPMALVALQRLGADDARLAAFTASYVTRLHPAPWPEPWPAGEPWRHHLGDPWVWPAYRSLFNDWLDQEGAAAMLPQVLPTLMQGVGAAAFHGLIRTAYAVDAGHSHELADALAYWACRWFTLGEPGLRMGRESDPAAVLAGLKPGRWPGELIAVRMADAARSPAFRRASAALRVDTADTLSRLAHHAAAAYAQTGDFTVLHLVTSAHAMRVLWPWLDDADRLPALRHYARAFVAGHLASGAPGSVATGAAPPPWPGIVERALASDDEHEIKLVYSCREQERAYGGDLWLRAAARAVAEV